MNLVIEECVGDIAPDLQVIMIEADVTNEPTTPALKEELEQTAADIAGKYTMPDINKRKGIAATRAAYKALGKEPNRYRPSCEALCRRVVKGTGLYYINNLVDLINVLSMASGYSIGGFDLAKIDGDTLSLGAGCDGEPFEGIGRGQLNIHCLPVYRDATGGIGTPTSDNERTKIDLDTTRLLMCINIYGEEMPVDETEAYAIDLLKRHAAARNIKVTRHSVK